MIKKISPTSRRALALAALAAAACGAAPSSSMASGPETFCVHQSGYACPVGSVDEGTDLQAALNNAEANPVGAGTPNVIDIGPGTYTSPAVSGFSYGSTNPVKIAGAGAGATILANVPTSANANSVFVGGGGLSSIGYTAVSLSGLSVNDVNANGNGLVLINGAADHIAVQSSAAGVTGLNLEYSTVSNASVSVSGSGSVGAYTESDGTDELSDVTVSAAGFGIRTAADTTVQRSDVSGGIALQDLRGAVQIDDSLLRGSSYGLVAADSNGQASIRGANDTIVHTDSDVAAPSYGVYAQSAAGNGASISIVNSIIHGFSYPFGTDAESGSATIQEADNNYDGTYLGGGVTTTQPIGGDPGFVDPAHGDYRLAASSPLIDAVTVKYLGQSKTDLDGKPRVVTVSHPSTPLDLGAYEYQPPASTPGGGTPGGGTPGGGPAGNGAPGSGTPGTGTPAGTGTPGSGNASSGNHGTTTTRGSRPTKPATVKLIPLGRIAVTGTRISLRLSCTGTAACTGIRVTGTAMRAHHHRVGVGSVGTHLAAGHKATIVLSLNRAGRMLLAKQGRLRVMLVVTVRDGKRVRTVDTVHTTVHRLP